ncbi:hypothetical protein WJX73_009532 [Symbiochloris irregularis]|uniref:ABC transporter domain-containing protein n=1 Tax=Symbiochloris irregularis TaxID=706552 RepID=A0AAW1NLV8_9CHLO
MYTRVLACDITAADFEHYLGALPQLSAQRRRPRGDLPALIHDLGLEQPVLNQPWSELSGGQAQRIILAIFLALKPSFLLLDEPTSALDLVSTTKVERVLKASGAGLVWVTHDDAQPVRVSGRLLQLPLGTEVPIESVASPQAIPKNLEIDPEPQALTEADLTPSPASSLFMSPGR